MWQIGKAVKLSDAWTFEDWLKSVRLVSIKKKKKKDHFARLEISIKTILTSRASGLTNTSLVSNFVDRIDSTNFVIPIINFIISFLKRIFFVRFRLKKFIRFILHPLFVIFHDPASLERTVQQVQLRGGGGGVERWGFPCIYIYTYIQIT